jgi:hypothetical protein
MDALRVLAGMKSCFSRRLSRNETHHRRMLRAGAEAIAYAPTSWSNGFPASPAIRFSTEIRAISQRVSTVALPR